MLIISHMVVNIDESKRWETGGLDPLKNHRYMNPLQILIVPPPRDRRFFRPSVKYVNDGKKDEKTALSGRNFMNPPLTNI